MPPRPPGSPETALAHTARRCDCVQLSRSGSNVVASIGPSIWETFSMLNENPDSASADGREISTPMVSPFTTGDHRMSVAASSRENDRPDSALPAPADFGLRGGRREQSRSGVLGHEIDRADDGIARAIGPLCSTARRRSGARLHRATRPRYSSSSPRRRVRSPTRRRRWIRRPSVFPGTAAITCRSSTRALPPPDHTRIADNLTCRGPVLHRARRTSLLVTAGLLPASLRSRSIARGTAMVPSHYTSRDAPKRRSGGPGDESTRHDPGRG